MDSTNSSATVCTLHFLLHGLHHKVSITGKMIAKCLIGVGVKKYGKTGGSKVGRCGIHLFSECSVYFICSP